MQEQIEEYIEIHVLMAQLFAVTHHSRSVSLPLETVFLKARPLHRIMSSADILVCTWRLRLFLIYNHNIIVTFKK